jgi:hypothetical protein
MDNPLTRTLFGDNLDKQFDFKFVLQCLDELNLINNGELAELAISEKSGVEKCKKMTENIDLVSGVQIKYAKVHPRPSGQRIATVSRRTTAPILLVVDDTKNKKQYYFNIPYYAHRHLSGNTIGIGFDSRGRPGDSQWFNYRVQTFDELCELAK